MEIDDINQALRRHQARCRETLQRVNILRLSRESGVSRPTLYRIRDGRAQPLPDTIAAIDRAMKPAGKETE